MSRLSQRAPAALVACCVLAGCEPAHAPRENPFSAGVCAHAAPDPGGAITPTAARTTAPELAVKNLDAQIAGYEGLLAASPNDVERAQAVVDRLLTRAQFLGQPDDFTSALEITARVVNANPNVAAAHSLRSRVLSAVHRWEDALAELDEARRLGADPVAVQRSRDAIELATGHADLGAALARADAWVAESPGVGSHGARANTLWKMGRFEEADRAFVDAMATYRDVAPWVVAWSDFQRGVMWSESANRPDLAEPLYRAAVERLPRYQVAVVHHAELLARSGRVDEAVAHLEAVATGAGDPEARGLLSQLVATRDASRADALKREALTLYEGLLIAHRSAYAEHGAEFFLNVAHDPTRALTLALENLADRPTSGAFELAVTAAQAAGEKSLACELIGRARREAIPTPTFCQVMHDAFESCP